MKIYLIADSKTAVIPIVPTGIAISAPKEPIEHETINGSVYLKGKLGSKSIEWDSFFPTKKYKFAESGSWTNGEQYVKLIKDVREKNLECRAIVVNNEGLSLMNCLVDIPTFEYSYDKTGDITYKIKLVELKQLC